MPAFRHGSGADPEQVGSTDEENIVPFEDQLANDLGELADMLAIYKFRLAYMNRCWATVAPPGRSVGAWYRRQTAPTLACVSIHSKQCVESTVTPPQTHASMKELAYSKSSK